jgi:flagellar FliL protein
MLIGGKPSQETGSAKDKEISAGHDASPASEGGEGEKDAAALVDVPAMLLNLRTANGEPRYLKLHFMLVAKNAGSVDLIKGRLPAVIDAYQPFLRELRPEDLAGSAAVFRIKEELLLRAVDVLGGDAVSDVLIQDMVQQ